MIQFRKNTEEKFMPKLTRKFMFFAFISWMLGIRELSMAWMLLIQPELLSDYITQAAVPLITFEVVYLVLGGLMLIIWPIAYRKVQWSNR
jgi:hypothetical protein